ncbi:MAG: RCC1 domain-containing protein [Longimicrobiales bacterium]
MTRIRGVHLLTLCAITACESPSESPEEPNLPPAVRVVGLAMAFQTTCALTADDKLHCWGENRFGEFGNGTDLPSDRPVHGAGNMSLASVHGSMGTPQMCGLTRDNAAYCWGYNSNGELGSVTASHAYSPVPVAGSLKFSTITSAYHTCGLNLNGLAYCWGSGLGGQLGTGSDTDARTPARVASDAAFATITNGMQFSCALKTDGEAECWGWEIGRGDGSGIGSVNRPVKVSGGLRFKRVSAGEEHVCALNLEARVYCWGKFTPWWPEGFRATPTPIPGPQRFVELTSGSRFPVYGASCGLDSGGFAYCWHSGLAPLPVPGGHRFLGFTGGHGRFCAYTRAGEAFCWRWDRERINEVDTWQPGQPVPIPNLASGG